MDTLKESSCIFVIFGATEDLAKRKLFPALYSLYKGNLLPMQFAVVGIGRREISEQEFKEKFIQKSIIE